MAAGLAALGAAVMAQENAMNVMRAGAAGGGHFVRASAINYTAVLPPPPAADSVAAQAEIETILQVQAWRTPEQIAWAKLIEQDHVFNHTTVLGAWFAAERLPRAAEFFRKLGEDLKAVDAAAKQPFQRARPWAVEARVQPCVARPASTSYPSGTAMQAVVWAELLAEIVPGKSAALRERAHRAGWGRVIGGVHWPSDVAAGQRLADDFLAVARRSAAFGAAWAEARAEIAAAAR
jgi:acid phosphatase (class A)